MKTEILKVRVTKTMKSIIRAIAKQDGESEAVIVRDAINQYVSKHHARHDDIYSFAEEPRISYGKGDAQKSAAAEEPKHPYQQIKKATGPSRH